MAVRMRGCLTVNDVLRVEDVVDGCVAVVRPLRQYLQPARKEVERRKANWNIWALYGGVRLLYSWYTVPRLLCATLAYSSNISLETCSCYIVILDNQLCSWPGSSGVPSL